MSTSSTEPARDEPQRLLEIGRIIRPHGLAGDVIVRLVTNRTERLDPGAELVATLPAGGERRLVVRSSSAHQRRFIVRFDGVSGIDAAEALRDSMLSAEPIVDDDALFVHDLIGSEVVDSSGTSHGRVASVQENPASDLLVGEAGWLVPLRFVVERSPGRIVVDVPDGMFE